METWRYGCTCAEGIFSEMTENEKKVYDSLRENGDMTLDQLARCT